MIEHISKTLYRYLLVGKSSKQKANEDRFVDENRITEIKKYALSRSPYYANYLKEVKGYCHSFSPDDIPFEKLLFLEKEHIRVGAVERLKVPGIRGFPRETTGTTGLPVRIYVDPATLYAQLAARWHFFSWYGLTPGVAEGRFWGRIEQRTVKAWLRDILLNRKVFQLDQRSPIRFTNEMKQLEQWNPAYFYGYASLLLKAAEFFDRLGIARPRPRLIVSTAEMLNESQRGYISSVFDCRVVQEYGCSEVDIIAFECPYGRYHLNHKRIFTEFIENGKGDREVVVSDLDNRCTPLLRYRLGDLAEVTDQACSCGRPAAHLRRIVGRTSDQLVPMPGGGFFHAVKFAHMIEKLSEQGYEIKRYKVEHIQPKKIIFRLDIDLDSNSKDKVILYLIKNNNDLFFDEATTEIVFGPIETIVKQSYYVRHFKLEN